MNDHACGLCGWRGLRKYREVNYSLALAAWVCSHCFHSDVYDQALAASREPASPVWL